MFGGVWQGRLGVGQYEGALIARGQWVPLEGPRHRVTTAAAAAAAAAASQMCAEHFEVCRDGARSPDSSGAAPLHSPPAPSFSPVSLPPLSAAVCNASKCLRRGKTGGEEAKEHTRERQRVQKRSEYHLLIYLLFQRGPPMPSLSTALGGDSSLVLAGQNPSPIVLSLCCCVLRLPFCFSLLAAFQRRTSSAVSR